MKVMILVKATADSEAGLPPDDQMKAMMAAMGDYNQQLIDAGILLDGDGMKPTSAGKRIAFEGDSRTVIDGPFLPAQEQVAGYWIWEVADMDEAVAWAKRCPNPMPGPSELEIRPFYRAEDFGAAMSPELLALEEAQRAQLADAQARDKLPMAQMIFVNLPVADLPRAMAFYAALGFTNNPHFTDETAACMVWSDAIHVMLLTHAKWRSFTDRPIPDAGSSEVMLALKLDNRADVDRLVEAGAAAGGTADVNPAADHGFMVQRTIADPDGHIWEPFWMDPAAVPPQD